MLFRGDISYDRPSYWSLRNFRRFNFDLLWLIAGSNRPVEKREGDDQNYDKRGKESCYVFPLHHFSIWGEGELLPIVGASGLARFPPRKVSSIWRKSAQSAFVSDHNAPL